ncbi:MAG: sulfatase [bacterium P3]|nr:MAG: sulfatase [bacterium P3]KWW40519.1 MAG: sulfatase [bacterium F083]
MKKLRYIFDAYLIGILFFTLFRLANTLVFCLGSETPPNLEGLYWKALVMGWRFDTLVSGFILFLPLIMILIGVWTRIRAKAYYAVAHHFTVTFFILSFVACAADIPYFLYFFTRLNAMAVNWMDSPAIVVDMIVKEPTYIGFALLFIAIATGYWFWMRRLWRRLLKPESEPMPVVWGVVVSMLLIGGCMLGMRGRLAKKAPMRVGNAYFCNNAFLNQIGLNPMFTFVKSLEEMSKSRNRPVQLIDPAIAHEVAWNERAEDYTPEAELRLPEGTNVVLVIMESMAYDKVGYFHPGRMSLTPNLDTILARSLYFDNAYSAGIHTYNGVYSTLYSHPALLAQHSMKHIATPMMCGLPHQLRKAGYQTIFCLTHDEGFDNIGGFLRYNGIETLKAQLDYPSSEVVGTWGVPDHVMLRHAIEAIDARDTNRPFMAAMLTCSDHGPYIYPDGIALQPRSKELKDKMVEYADWSIGQFMAAARKHDWYEHTLFIFVADHGASTQTNYDMSLSYHHIPIVFYYPGRIAPTRRDELALQIDITPTVLGMLLPEYDNNTLGVDLFRQRRPYAYFSADDKIGVLDSTYFYVYRPSQQRASLYHYRDNDPVDHIASDSARVAPMRRYAFSMIQESQQMLLEQRTDCNQH